MSCMCEDIAEIQREVAGLCTGELRAAIGSSVDLLEAAIEHSAIVCGNAPDGAADEQVVAARDVVIVYALLTALYVRELTLRPAPRFTRVGLSIN